MEGAHQAVERLWTMRNHDHVQHPRCSCIAGSRVVEFPSGFYVCTFVPRCIGSPKCCWGSNTLSFSFFELNLLKIKKQTFNEGFRRSHCCMRFGAVSLCCGVSEDLLDMSLAFRQFLANSYEDLSYPLWSVERLIGWTKPSEIVLTGTASQCFQWC